MKISSKDVKKMTSKVKDCAWGSLVILSQKNESAEDVRNLLVIYWILHWTTYTIGKTGKNDRSDW